MKFKEGVPGAEALTPEMAAGAEIAEEAYQRFLELTVTSTTDGVHRSDSRHYSGNAIDLRTRHLTRKAARDLAEALKKTLSPDFDVVLEPTHLHVEYDPETRKV